MFTHGSMSKKKGWGFKDKLETDKQTGKLTGRQTDGQINMCVCVRTKRNKFNK